MCISLDTGGALNNELFGQTDQLFFGHTDGIFDTANVSHPFIWDIAQRMRQNQWDKNDFKYGTCANDFRTTDPDIVKVMIDNLTFQWEVDTLAANVPMRIISNICSHSGLDQAYAEINVNEKTHAGTYSEIFRLAVPGTYLEHQARIKDFTDSRDRMSVLNKVATECFVATTRYALGDIPYSQQLFNTVFEFMFGLWCMERGQFMSSFAQTFIITGLGETMMPVEAAVQRICNDELTIHAQLGEYVFKTMLESEQGQVAMKECRDDLERIAYMVHSHENRWNSRSLNPLKNRRLYGISIQDLDNWVAVNMAPIYAASGIDPMSYAPDNFTLPIVERLVDIRSSRPASMERNGGLYTVGALTKDTSGPLPNVGGISF